MTLGVDRMQMKTWGTVFPEKGRASRAKVLITNIQGKILQFSCPYFFHFPLELLKMFLFPLKKEIQIFNSVGMNSHQSKKTDLNFTQLNGKVEIRQSIKYLESTR